MATAPVSEVLSRAPKVESVRPDDARAGADYQRVEAEGRAYFLQRLSPASDWIMRVTGDHVHRPYLVWRAGIMDKAPSCVDHTVVADRSEVKCTLPPRFLSAGNPAVVVRQLGSPDGWRRG